MTELPPAAHLARQIHARLQAGDLEGADHMCRQAEQLPDPDMELTLQSGKVHYFRKRFDKAIPLFQRILAEYPEQSEVRIALWACYHDGGDFDNMLKLAAEFERHPLNADELFFAYRSYLAASDWQKAARLEQRALASAEAGELRHDLVQALLLDLCAVPNLSPDQIFRIHRRWGEVELAGKPALCDDRLPPPDEGKRLKIGYLSADFNAHPVGFFIANILHAHDRERFEVYCYAHLGRRDEVTEKLRRLADHFVDITPLTHADAAARIHADGIHILIDLGGHTSDTRLPVLAYRPAPVQMTYLGYPNTTGLATVDYRITDRHAEDGEGTRYIERLLYMPQSFLCYGASPSQPERVAESAETKKQIVFASFNNVRKITPQVIEAWSRILKRVPGSRLMLKFKSAENPHIRHNLLGEFEKHGIAPARIELLPFIKQLNSHLTQYNQVDIALDTFPYHGTTTTCDALSMGVPVVTLEGQTHAQRVSCSIMKNIGFEESITHSVDAYVEKAVALASNRQGLALLHQALPTLFRHSILCQPDRFTRQMEELYEQAWQEKATGQMKEKPSMNNDRQMQARQPEWIFIVGMLRSGSTWCYNVVRELFERSGTGSVVGYVGEGEAVDEALQSPADYVATPRLMKFHAPTDAALAMLDSGRAIAIYSQRDLRDVVVSIMDFNDVPFEYVLETRLDRMLKHDRRWKQAANVAGLEYGDILDRPEDCIRQMATWLGLQCSEQLAAEIAASHSRAATRKRIEEIGGRAAAGKETAKIKQVAESRYFDTDTLLHTNHISSGETGRFRNRLSSEQIATLNTRLREWLLGEGYETGAAFEQTTPPATTAQPGTEKKGNRARRTIRIENDLLVTVPDDLNLMTPYILEEQHDWFEDEIKFIRHLIRPGMQIIDIGANYGCYALTMAKLAGPEGRLWAFEPCSATADLLEESIRANGLGQLQLIRAALSNRQGTATLLTQENAELNSLTSSNGGSGTESVPLYRLDDCLREHGWQNIDFMKLDAEGEEIRILEGGTDFFKSCAPLVMFELKHGATVNEGLIQAFRDMGHGIYKLVPGLGMLVPFDPTEEPDPFQLNLFGCRRDRAEQLQAAGLLSIGEGAEELQISSADAWADYLKQSPYAAPLLQQWQAAESGLPGETEYRTALNAYAMAQRARGRPESYPWLRAAFIQLIMALEAHASLPRLLTLARIATDLGRRSAAAQALHQFIEVIGQEQRFNPVEPFLAASERAASIDPAGELANWCLAQALAERERLQAFSSYFTGSNSLSALNVIASLNYDDAEMGRRRELIARRFAQ